MEDKNQTKINFPNGITFLYDNENFLIGIDDSEYDFKISELVYFENNKKICIQFEKSSKSIKYFEENILKVFYKNNAITLYFYPNILKRYPNSLNKTYCLEFLENGYYLNLNNQKKEFYSYAGIRIDKYPLIQKNSPDGSYGTKTKIVNERFGSSFECTNLLGLKTGGQLYNGTTYLYLYHLDGTYVKTYSDGDNRYYNSRNEWEKSVKVSVNSNGDQKIEFTNGKIKTYNILGEFVNES